MRTIHIVLRDGRWMVCEGGSESLVQYFESKAEAVAAANKMAPAGEAEIIVHEAMTHEVPCGDT